MGGGAVELYTAGAYTTGDFDFVGGVPAPVSKVLEQAGFERKGRHWIRAEGEIFVKFPGAAIQEGEQTAILDVDGTHVLTLSAEDIIIDCLAAWQFWRSTTDGANAFLIWKAQKSRLDRRRLLKLADRRKVGKALESLERFVTESKRESSPEEVEQWTRDLP